MPPLTSELAQIFKDMKSTGRFFSLPSKVTPSFKRDANAPACSKNKTKTTHIHTKLLMLLWFCGNLPDKQVFILNHYLSSDDIDYKAKKKGTKIFWRARDSRPGRAAKKQPCFERDQTADWREIFLFFIFWTCCLANRQASMWDRTLCMTRRPLCISQQILWDVIRALLCTVATWRNMEMKRHFLFFPLS